MKKIARTIIVTSLLALAAGAAHAHGQVECGATPKTEWKPQMDLQSKLVAEGWKVRKVQVYHDCYEVYGFDGAGARVEAFFHPKAFERVEPQPEEPKK